MRASAVAAAFIAVCAAPAAAAPGDVLYDQYDHASTIASSSQNFEAALDSSDSELADDFVVPNGVGWSITGVEVQGAYFHGPGPATTANVSVYANASDLPGTLLQSRPNQSFTGGPSFAISLSSSIGLGGGRYWLSVQANQDFGPAGQWGWVDRTEQSNGAAAWQNPGGGLGFGCTAWAPRTACIGNMGAADQVFRLTGTVGAPPPPPPPPPPTRCRVPRVIGLTLPRAKSRIRSRHCAVGRVRRRVSARRAGKVIAQSPGAGAVRRAGTRVNLVVGRR